MTEFKHFQINVGRWGDKTFGTGNKRTGIVNHLFKEVVELALDHEPEEAGDCLLLLLQHAHEVGYDLFEEVKRKYKINLGRKWGKPDKNGVIEHIQREGV